eukprot:CAMPEP_0181359940 /NCGR_PEP_ID=MMETSP1106-20121128/6378_1 /TAXON_ID=81844 /ORGANISM="Mantoniella antarctica, Strain SL-175" /LENGTH=97 /DNA_ID=CAMNT_0023473135 /DNA_START=567 /DNA_END=860 /DNA_ORIENTATION=+
MRHGPHHGAQKSTSTGTSLFSTSASNVASVTTVATPFVVASSAMTTTPRDAARRQGRAAELGRWARESRRDALAPSPVAVNEVEVTADIFPRDSRDG